MKRILFLMITAAFMLSCERSKDIEGPSLNDLYGDFTMLQDFSASANSVNFSTGANASFSALFSKTVTWQLEITGQTSGGVKQFSGISNSLDELNTRWVGDISTLPMFKAEICTAILSVPNENFADTLTIRITEVKTNKGFVVSDFESGLNQGFIRFVQSGLPPMVFDTVNSPVSPEGNTYYEMSGEVPFTDDLGNILMPTSAFTDSNIALPANDQAVFFNFFARKGPQVFDEILVFQFMEDDNDNGVYNPGADDLYEYVLDGLPEDWAHFSVQYSDLVASSPNGNQRLDPDKLIEMRLLPISPPPARSRIQTFVDYMIFTVNEPLKP